MRSSFLGNRDKEVSQAISHVVTLGRGELIEVALLSFAWSTCLM
jgi:hypothetical protein